MSREAKCRRVAFIPPVKAFKPMGIPASSMEEIVLKVEEAEAIRLKNHLNLGQEECAQMMMISRPTFQRILGEAYAKIADALSNGKGIRIEGGSYCLGNGYCRRRDSKLAPMENCEFYDIGLELTRANIQQRPAYNLLAVAAVGTSTDSRLEARFGRCQYFWLWNQETDAYSLIERPYIEGAHSSGTDSAQKLMEAGVGSLIVNHIGPKAFLILQRANITVYSGPERITVSEAIKMFRNGQLHQLESADR
ncbi:MAG TPA: DUF134 domain-containing protein [Syntrophomonadaceae bacterium]|nr:DUF134 domain-containing protein [Syntrophomonadaceae bacterium]HRX22064.1 DUF134 domain-containing protein [Syntrophomonadaceae bacterium]